MRIPGRERSRRPNTLVSLINIVFLMLIFFLVAGTLADSRIPQIAAPDAEVAGPRSAPRGVISVTADGSIFRDGRAVTREALAAALAGERDRAAAAPVTILADRNLPAAALVDLVAALTAAGGRDVALLVTGGGSP